MILEITQLSGAPKPASEPVSGWIQPIVMAFVPLEVDPEPLMAVLHASSSPPAPMMAAPAPTARSIPRRLMSPNGPLSPDCTDWSLICHRSPCEVVSQRPRRQRCRMPDPGSGKTDGKPAGGTRGLRHCQCALGA